MANIKSNIKRSIQNKKIYTLRKGQRSDLKKAIRVFRESEGKKVSISDLYAKADKLASKNAISKNKARRIKSRAMARLNNLNKPKVSV